MWVWVFNDAPPPLPPQEAGGKTWPAGAWTDTGAEAVGGGEPRIITGFWSIRPCLTQALVKKTALYGKLMVKLKTRQAYCSSLEAITLRKSGLPKSLGSHEELDRVSFFSYRTWLALSWALVEFCFRTISSSVFFCKFLHQATSSPLLLLVVHIG